MLVLYARFRNARVPRVASVVDAGAVVFRTVAGFVLFFTASEAVCVRGTVGFFVAAVAVPVVGFLAPAPVRVGLLTVVPEDVVEETVPVLFLRSPCRVAGRGRGERMALGPVAARTVVFFACDCGWLSLAADVVAPRGRAAAPAALRGLEAFSGEVGRDRYEGCPFSGEARNGDCG